MFFKEVVRRVFQLFSDEGSPLFELEVKQLMAGKKLDKTNVREFDSKVDDYVIKF